MLFRPCLLRGHGLAKLLGPARLVDLLAAGEGDGIGGDVAGDDRAGADEGAGADRHRRDQGAVRADEGPLPNYRPIFEEAVIIAGDGARADIGAGA